jgi:hypothetical protein
MPGFIGLDLVTWGAPGLVLAAEPPAPLAVWDQCRDEALAEAHRQTQALIARCFPAGNFVCTEDEVRALPEADALILDRCGPEPLTAVGALQARSCDMLFRFACLTPRHGVPSPGPLPRNRLRERAVAMKGLMRSRVQGMGDISAGAGLGERLVAPRTRVG